VAADPGAPAVMRLSPRDNVAVALRPLAAGEIVLLDGVPLVIQRHVPVGQKLAAETIAAGAPVLKYHCPIGIARRPIAAGALISARNVERDFGAPPASPG
jgi:altronate hydrolase